MQVDDVLSPGLRHADERSVCRLLGDEQDRTRLDVFVREICGNDVDFHCVMACITKMIMTWTARLTILLAELPERQHDFSFQANINALSPPSKFATHVQQLVAVAIVQLSKRGAASQEERSIVPTGQQGFYDIAAACMTLWVRFDLTALDEFVTRASWMQRVYDIPAHDNQDLHVPRSDCRQKKHLRLMNALWIDVFKCNGVIQGSHIPGWLRQPSCVEILEEFLYGVAHAGLESEDMQKAVARVSSAGMGLFSNFCVEHSLVDMTAALALSVWETIEVFRAGDLFMNALSVRESQAKEAARAILERDGDRNQRMMVLLRSALHALRERRAAEESAAQYEEEAGMPFEPVGPEPLRSPLSKKMRAV